MRTHNGCCYQEQFAAMLMDVVTIVVLIPHNNKRFLFILLLLLLVFMLSFHSNNSDMLAASEIQYERLMLFVEQWHSNRTHVYRDFLVFEFLISCDSVILHHSNSHSMEKGFHFSYALKHTHTKLDVKNRVSQQH